MAGKRSRNIELVCAVVFWMMFRGGLSVTICANHCVLLMLLFRGVATEGHA